MPPNAANPCHRNGPGPTPVFTERLVVKIRPDQADRLAVIARALRLNQSEVVRYALDLFTESVEAQAMFHRMKALEVEP